MKKKYEKHVSRRSFLHAAGIASASLALGGCGLGENLLPRERLEEFIQGHFQEMSPDEINKVMTGNRNWKADGLGRGIVVRTRCGQMAQ